MQRAGNRRLSVARTLALAGLGVVVAVACGGPQTQTGNGAVCFRADDCKPGFACVPEAAGSSKRVCSSDLTSIVSMVDGAPLEAAAPVADGAAGAASGGGPAAGGEATVAGAPAGGAANGGSAGSGRAGAPSAGAGNAGAATGGAGASAGTGG